MTFKPGHKPPKPFKKGNPGGPGRPPIPADIKEARQLNKIEFERITNQLIYLPSYRIKELLDNKETPNIVKMIGAICLKAERLGDHQRATFILDRLIGKVPDKIEGELLQLVDQVKYLRELPQEELLKITHDALDSVEGGSKDAEDTEISAE